MVEKKVTTKTVTTEEFVKNNASKNQNKAVPAQRKIAKDNSSIIRVESQLIENFVSLQKVLTSLSAKFEDMTRKLSEVLDLFEESAKAFVKKDIPKEQPSVVWQKEVLEKIDNLFEQNKILARGLTLIHEEAVKYSMPTSPSIMNTAPSMTPVPLRGELIKNPIRTGIPERTENASLNSKPRTKEEEEPAFDIQESPFFVKK